MQWELMSKMDAAQITGSWQGLDKESFDKLVNSWEQTIPETLNEEYQKLRTELLNAYKKAKQEVENNSEMKGKKDYYTDLLFALYQYDILKSHGFSVRLASNDQIWIYLCVRVLPDIVHSRYRGTKVKTEGGVEYRNVNEERFWRTRRRIYLKVLWWYIYLSLQLDDTGKEDLEQTFKVLKDNSTDEVVQIVERSGAAGYRVDVYREIMNYYAHNRDKYDNKRFRHVMVLNTARTQIVEPLLMDGGVKTYVRELFEYFNE